ncbi:NAD-dependent protein deacetylase [Aquipuribacter nitratireducens]|uniref:NAD-dependent protein deacetylase n=1 Tax=Aquipuribacter nitratireducens TaxID=650104 RepID=A0ABW0GQ52_9MICO
MVRTVPPSMPVPVAPADPACVAEQVERARDVLAGGGVVALTGAGLSTDSGIPDYRGPGSPRRTPMTYQDFTRSDAARRRYWARSHVGWHRMAAAAPNDGHRALAALGAAGVVDAVITQNVDGLHGQAGSARVVELHGALARVVCLDCRALSPRRRLHERLAVANPGWAERTDVPEADVAPDGDVVIDDTADFTVVPCETCGGVLKPDVVFFGENVPPPRVAECYEMVDGARALLVAGTSCTVFSGRRFVKRAASLGLPVVVVNRGPTRAAEHATVHVDAGCSDTLARLVGHLGAAA